MSSIDQQANRWVVQQEGEGLDAAGRMALEAWCARDPRHRGAFARAMAIHHLLGQDPADVAPLAAHDDAPARRRRTGAWRALGLGGLAAGLLLAVALAALQARPDSITLATAIGEFRRVPLPDQSIASINSGSQLTFTLSGRLRQASLARGEAWFDVARDKARPFVVDAGDARVRAVGTSFSVARGAAGAEVLVTEGTVEVWREGDAARPLLVTAGEHAVVPAAAGAVTVARQPDEVARRLAWREGRLVFVNEPLEAAVADFNRYSRKRIVVADRRLLQRSLVGNYRVDNPEQFARAVGLFFGVPSAVTHDRIVIGDVRLLDDRPPAQEAAPH